ncbi:hypothetical protein [Bradyrhizobium sp. Ec3.3]|uniref:hypothetical protein n=1 Tax=Bradyrhizobium sp. Ec3.3 TaxID=189753 RepID=UPI0004817F66|nr:hypothetical protein [Bradyrhizobium sp. Ec3.3]
MALSVSEIRALSDERLLGCIAEECSEVTKAAMKHQRFGARPTMGSVHYNNVKDVMDEFCQLYFLISEYRRRFGWL